MESGIYKIVCIPNQMVYIGQSIDVSNRWKQHLNDLRNNKHCNKGLQEDFLKYGEINFEFSIVATCEASVLDLLELHYIDKYKKNNQSYNIKTSESGRHKERVPLTPEEYKKIVKFKESDTIDDETIKTVLAMAKTFYLNKFARKKYIEFEYNSNSIKKVVFEGIPCDDNLMAIRKCISLALLYIMYYVNEYISEKYLYMNEIVETEVLYRNLASEDGKLTLNCKVIKTGEQFKKTLYF